MENRKPLESLTGKRRSALLSLDTFVSFLRSSPTPHLPRVVPVSAGVHGLRVAGRAAGQQLSVQRRHLELQPTGFPSHMPRPPGSTAICSIRRSSAAAERPAEAGSQQGGKAAWLLTVACSSGCPFSLTRLSAASPNRLTQARLVPTRPSRQMRPRIAVERAILAGRIAAERSVLASRFGTPRSRAVAGGFEGGSSLA